MKQKIAEIPVNEGILLYLQALNYELEGRKVLCAHLARANGGVPPEEESRYLDAWKEYQEAFRQLVAELAPGQTDGKRTFTLDFVGGRLIIWEGGSKCGG